MSLHPEDGGNGGLPVWWTVMVVLLVGFVSVLMAATLTSYAERRHPVSEGVRPTLVAIAETPKTLKDSIDQAADPTLDLRVDNRNRFPGRSGLEFESVPGAWNAAPYLLTNRHDGDRQRSVSERVDLARDERTGRFRDFHVYLDADGGMVAKSNHSPVFRIGLCGDLEWINTDHVLHHSIERDGDGFYSVPIHLEPSSVDFGARLFMDDAIAKVSPEGQVVWTCSLAQVFAVNGLEVFTLGIGAESEDDPIHRNDIQPVLEGGEIWRNRSMVALCRPETDEILWWPVGPWIHQHDVDIVDDRTITVFDDAAKKFGRIEIRPDPVNGMWTVDVVENSFEPIQPEAFADLDIRTTSSGRSELLPDGSVYVEEGVYGRLVVLDPDGSPRMTCINRTANGGLYKLNRSRILDREAGDAVRALLEDAPCGT